MEKKHLVAGLVRLFREETGATAIEYGLLVAFIAAAIMASLGGLGTQLKTTFTIVSTTLTAANAAG